jgi:hypothetical protein
MAESKAARVFLRDWLFTGALPPLTDDPAGRLLAEGLAAAAREQGLAGLLHREMEAASVSWPPEVGAALAAARRTTVVRGVRQLALAARVMGRLEEAGIRALPLKGAAILESLYDSEGDRGMADVDLLVLEGAREAQAILRADGFVECEPADHVSVFREPHTSAVLELHHSVTSCPGLFPLDPEGVWSRRRTGAGQVRWLPSAEDLLVQLCMHAAFQHGLVLSLVQWLDFRRLLERLPVDPDRLAEAARVARAEAALGAALLTAEAVVGATLPPWLRERAEKDLPRGLRPWLVARSPLDFVGPSPPSLLRVRFGLLAGRRLELFRRTLVPAEDPRPVRATLARAAGLARRWLLPARRAPVSRPATIDHDEGGPATSDFQETVLRDCLLSFDHVRLRATGVCMVPEIRPGDTLLLARPALRPPRLGDVVLARHAAGLRLHRLVWGPPFSPPHARWRTQADRGALWDPALAPGDVLATVVGIADAPGRRGGRRVFSSFRSLARGSRAWMRLRLGGAA